MLILRGKPPPKAAGPFESLKLREALKCSNRSKGRGRLDVKAILLALVLAAPLLRAVPSKGSNHRRRQQKRPASKR